MIPPPTAPRVPRGTACREKTLPARLLLLILACAVLSSGCLSLRRTAPRPGRTIFKEPTTTVPARVIGNLLIVETKWDRHGPYRFLVDTGSSVTHVTPELANRYVAEDFPPPPGSLIRVRSSTGESIELPPTTLKQIALGDVTFRYVPAVIYDCATLSAHLGIKIDGILGFPLFRDTLLTLDYPNSRVILAQRQPAPPLLPGSTIPFNNPNKTPLIPLQLGETTFFALIDSGSDAPLSLNPIGLDPTFAVAPRPGATIGTLTGDHTQQIARLADTVHIGDYAIPRPIVDVTDELSALGGRVLRHFTLTFDQERNQVTFYRNATQPLQLPQRRTAGLSFTKTPAYWRVAGVIPDSPAAARVQPGDLVTRINGEPVAQWDVQRYEQLLASAQTIAFTFLNGTRESEARLEVFDLVP